MGIPPTPKSSVLSFENVESRSRSELHWRQTPKRPSAAKQSAAVEQKKASLLRTFFWTVVIHIKAGHHEAHAKLRILHTRTHSKACPS